MVASSDAWSDMVAGCFCGEALKGERQHEYVFCCLNFTGARFWRESALKFKFGFWGRGRGCPRRTPRSEASEKKTRLLDSLALLGRLCSLPSGRARDHNKTL